MESAKVVFDVKVSSDSRLSKNKYVHCSAKSTIGGSLFYFNYNFSKKKEMT